ncbi:MULTISPECIES: EndoU domain-containing protein [Pseudomonas]|nr:MULTISPECIES: EndoU domain-containing protein [Pseudomonas]AZC51524.1 hypothetical protein C4K35_3945 [Pseudomonas chlororaphis subsp. piscium]AZC58128.1 hypothetical protein C4K34_3967 [Pseudomonas chlororaphis subsp. piscium]AZC64334.1 hypothetical protein C4K33_3846 [Pseudomonas chlororaphis subsp. piscium]AZC70586.1 hypothetical protein C4K32_3928 [Pseudomonas chlororaphis subsp. piscium]AZC76817.1 hypothetical protein C4K31_3918 [Pseudomonas chlororaphis subsp. piscium]
MSTIPKALLLSASALTLVSCSNITSSPTSELATATCISASLPTTNPPINEGHIFCGELVYNKNTATYDAKGFHSTASAVSVSTIKANLSTTATPLQAPTPILLPPLTFNTYSTQKYTLSNFTIQSGSNFSTKQMSTMFPNSCSASQVLKSIEYAYKNMYSTANPIPAPYTCNTNASNRCGPSSPTSANKTYCQIAGKPIPLQTFFDGKAITTAYPL